MPKVSRDSAPQRQEAGPVVDLRDELDGYTVSFTSLLEDIDATPFMKGLPDDRCQCPHWGYVFKGKMTARYADRDEVFEAGDACYIPPGHAATVANTVAKPLDGARRTWTTLEYRPSPRPVTDGPGRLAHSYGSEGHGAVTACPKSGRASEDGGGWHGGSRAGLERVGAVCLGGGRPLRDRAGGGDRGRDLGGSLSQNASAAKIADTLHEHRERLLVIAYLSIVYAASFLVYLCSLYNLLRGEHNHSRILGSLVLAGGVLFIALHAVSDIGINSFLGAKLTSVGPHHVQGVAYTLYLMTYGLDSVGDVFGSLAFAAGLLVIEPRPAALAWMGFDSRRDIVLPSRLRPWRRHRLVRASSRPHRVRAIPDLRTGEQCHLADARKRGPQPRARNQVDNYISGSGGAGTVTPVTHLSGRHLPPRPTSSRMSIPISNTRPKLNEAVFPARG